MNYKKILIIISSLIVLLLSILIIYFILKPRIYFELIGDKYIEINVYDNYIDKGYNSHIFNLLGYKKESNVIVNNPVDTSVIGNYIITYKIDYFNKEYTDTRVVRVVDKEKPKIIINDEDLNICKGSGVKYIVYDNYDKDITNSSTYKIKDNILYIEAYDSSNNYIKGEYKVKYKNNKSYIKLNNNEHIYINLNDEYFEYGAYAYNECLNDISSNIEIINNVDTSNIGTYEAIYSVKNIMDDVSVKRYVHVVRDNKMPSFTVKENSKIYLTFDDGPNKNTKDILNILNKYNIKATFFVTNQFSDYTSIIKDIYDSGHSVGAHTYSHKWSIYKSEDSYFEDLNKINEVIKNYTGSYTNIIRFPGGSGNAVSRDYNKGIMSRLTKMVNEKGYRYYDWDVDSTDTAKNNTPISIYDNTVKQIKGKDSYIILMHDIKKNTLDALPSIIEYLQMIGYSFDKIDESVPEVHSKVNN